MLPILLKVSTSISSNPFSLLVEMSWNASAKLLFTANASENSWEASTNGYSSRSCTMNPWRRWRKPTLQAAKCNWSEVIGRCFKMFGWKSYILKSNSTQKEGRKIFIQHRRLDTEFFPFMKLFTSLRDWYRSRVTMETYMCLRRHIDGREIFCNALLQRNHLSSLGNMSMDHLRKYWFEFEYSVLLPFEWRFSWTVDRSL